jgi:hypothetical protein
VRTGLIGAPSLVALTLFLGAAPALADPPGPVTACASDTQTGAGLNLARALAFGGVIRFNCPPGTTIRMTGRYVLSVSTLIDGGDTVTLDGQGAFGPMLRASANVILRRLTVRGFAQRPARPLNPPFMDFGRDTGSVLSANDAELDHVTIATSQFPVEVKGTATVRDSAFIGNRGGLTLIVRGAAHIERTRFIGNARAVSMVAGWVRSCTFVDQTLGAVRVDAAAGAVEIRHSTFTGTRGGPALLLSQRAGGNGPQTIAVRANVFQDNDGGAAGGAISLLDVVQEARDRGASPAVVNRLATLPPARFVLGYNRFIGNRGRHGGAIAADLAHTRGMDSTGDLFVGNAAGGDGGAVAVTGGPLRMDHALFKGNRSGARGAALSVAPGATAVLANALVVGNIGPAGTIEGNAVTLANVTVADNDAVGLLLETPAARVANVLLSRNRPTDCARVPPGAFRGGALQSDGSCPGVATGEAFLDEFYVPAAGSPALRADDPAICRGAQVGGVDFSFQGRVHPAACALGAFERPPLRKLSSGIDRSEGHTDQEDDFSDDEGYRPPPLPTGTEPYATPTALPVPYRPPPAAVQTGPMDTVLAALAAGEAAPVERVRLFIERDRVADIYYVDRVDPGRLHLIKNPRQGGAEIVVIDGMQWVRTDTSWRKTPALPTAGLVPSMAGLFRAGLTDLVETPGPDGGRSVEGEMAWTNGASCTGRILLRIDAGGLPSLLRFEGVCGGKPTRFRQAFSHTGPLTIAPPL